MVNTPEKKLFKPVERIQKGQPMPTGMPPRENPKLYCLLISYKDRDELSWKFSLGREEAIDDIKDYIRADADIEKSVVLVNGGDMASPVSLYWFMKKMQEIGLSKDFDIDEYLEGDCQELVEASLAEAPPEQVSVVGGGEDFDVEGTEDIY